MALSAVLKREGRHKCEVFVLQQSQNLLKEILEYEPTVIGFTCMSGEHIWARAFAKEIKVAKPSQFVIMGGVHPTIYPEVIESCEDLDAVCIGEGEYSLLKLVACLESGDDFTDIANLWIRQGAEIIRNEVQPLIADLDSLPYMDRSIYYDKFPILRDDSTKLFFVGRGCPHHCSYCHNHVMMRIYHGKGHWVRLRSVCHIIDELKEVKEKYGYEWILFNDDTLNIKRDWFMELMDRFENEIGAGFICNIRVDHLDEEIVERMVKAGCDRVIIGVEHGDYKIRRDILKRNITDEQLITISRAFSDRGVRVFTSSLIGLPGETVDDAYNTYKLLRAMHPTHSNAHVLEPYPRTAIYDYCSERGLLRKDYGWDSITAPAATFQYTSKALHKQGFVIEQPNMRELTNLKEFCHLLVHHPWAWPIVRLLIKLPHNRFFNSIWQWGIYGFKVKYAKGRRERIDLTLRLLKHLVAGRGA